MRDKPPRERFEHHGVPVETREQWAARQAAARARAGAEIRQFGHARAEADRGRAAEAEKVADAEPDRSLVPKNAQPRPTWLRVAAVVGLALAGMAVIWVGGRTRGDEAAAPAVPRVNASDLATPARPTLGSDVQAKKRVRDKAPDIWGGLTGTQSWSGKPEIDPQPAGSGWWCICYKTGTGEDHTACRRLGSECVALREMIQTQGSKSILQGSASPEACKYVRGPYPWIGLGHADAWGPSSFSDAPNGDRELRQRRRATQATGVCAL